MADRHEQGRLLPRRDLVFSRHNEHLPLSEEVRSHDEISQLLGIQHRLFCGLGRPPGGYDG
jgi:hypothetical protein